MYLLDTNVVSELRRPRPDPTVVQWVRSVPYRHLHLCAVTVGEIQAGIELKRSSDPVKAQELEDWLELVITGYDVLPIDASAFRERARLMHRQPRKLIEDALVAAVAVVNELTVATRNVRDFRQLNVPVVNPFAAEPRD